MIVSDPNPDQCRLFGFAEAQTKAQARLAMALRQAFEDEPAVVIVEPGLSGGRSRPPDLVLLHRKLGVHVFEIKGVSIDQVLGVEGGCSVRIDYGSRVYHRDPTSQALNAIFDIKACVEREILEEIRLPLIPWVLWPKITREQWCNKLATADRWPEEWQFRESIEDSQWIKLIRDVGRRRMAERGLDEVPAEEWASLDRAFGDNAVLSIDPRQRPARRVTETTLGWFFDQRAMDYATLSEEQQELIRQEWESGPRLVRGVAGSGKTIVLASHLSRRLKRLLTTEGDLYTKKSRLPRLLAVCFNRTLVPHLRSKIEVAFRQRTGGDLPDGCVHVAHLNDVMYQLSERGFVPYIPVGRMADEERSAHYLDALRESYHRRPDAVRAYAYDAVYVDEGQDFLEDEFRCLKAICRQTYEGDEPSLFVFYDDAQNLYARHRPRWNDLGLRMVGRSYVMTEAFRNTRAIVEPAFNVLLGSLCDTGEGAARGFTDIAYLEQKNAVRRRVGGSYETLFAKRVDGFAPRTHRFPGEREEEHWLLDKVRGMIGEQAVRPQDMLVLTFQRKRAETIAGALRHALGPEMIQLATQEKDETFGSRGRLTVSTVASAKGLDAYSVLMVSAHDFGTDIKGRTAFYVGCTRAREHLEVSSVGESPLLDEYQAALDQINLPCVGP